MMKPNNSNGFDGLSLNRKGHDKAILAIFIIVAVVIVVVSVLLVINRGNTVINKEYNHHNLQSINGTTLAVNSQSFENISSFSSHTTFNLTGREMTVPVSANGQHSLWKDFDYLKSLSKNYSFVACSDDKNFSDVVPCSSGLGKYMLFYVNVTPYTKYLANVNSSFRNYYFYTMLCINSSCDYYYYSSNKYNAYSNQRVLFRKTIDSSDFHYDFSVNIIPSSIVQLTDNLSSDDFFNLLSEIVSQNRSVKIYSFSGDFQ